MTWLGKFLPARPPYVAIGALILAIASYILLLPHTGADIAYATLLPAIAVVALANFGPSLLVAAFCFLFVALHIPAGGITPWSLDHFLFLVAAIVACCALRFVPRKHSEGRSTRQLQNRLAAIVESSEDAIIAKDLSGTITSWNAGAEALFGYSAAEAIGKNIIMVIPPERRHEEQEIIARISRGERVPSTETVRQTKSGQLIDVSLTVSPLRDDQGNIVGASKIARDISLRKRADTALREASERFEALVQASAQIVWSTDPDGRIVEDSPSWRAFTGQTVEQWLGNKSSEAIHPDDHDPVMTEWGAAIADQRPFEMEFRLRNSNEWRWVLTRAVPLLRADGSVRSWVGMNSDITQQKDNQIALQSSKEAAEAASRAKDHFLAIVSHELRTPLTPILAAISHLQTREDLPADVQDDIKMVCQNAHHQARLVDDLLSLTRLSKGKIMLHQETVDAHMLIRAVIAQFQGEIDRKRIELTVGLRATDPYIWADTMRLQQVLGNLLGNAVKFTPENGAISVRTSLEHERFIIQIRDSGMGIEPEVLSRLFAPFEQGEKTVTRQYGGLGLGLSIARQMVELHGGVLTASSEGRDKGATFTVNLLAAPRPHLTPDIQGGDQTSLPEKALSVLLVEDHPDTRRIMAKLLKSLGYLVEVAGSVAESRSIATERRFDLLVSDIGLPDGSGLDVVRELYEREAVKYAIAISGFGQPEDIRRSREAGFAEHLVKPIDFECLRDRLAVAASRLVA